MKCRLGGARACYVTRVKVEAKVTMLLLLLAP